MLIVAWYEIEVFGLNLVCGNGVNFIAVYIAHSNGVRKAVAFLRRRAFSIVKILIVSTGRIGHLFGKDFFHIVAHEIRLVHG